MVQRTHRRALLMILLTTGGGAVAGDVGLAPHGEFHYLDTRRAQSVAAPLGPPDLLAVDAVHDVEFSASRFRWHDGRTCAASWNAIPVETVIVDTGDPILADTQIGPTADHVTDHRRNQVFEFHCGGELWGRMLLVDRRLGIVATAGGARYHVFQAPVGKSLRPRLESALRDRKFLATETPTEADLDRALGFYLEYLGSPYRFRRPAISDNLLSDLTD